LYRGATLEDSWSLLLLGGASICLYGGGVALNDVFDAEVDRRDRPARPIPSGAVTSRTAVNLSSALLGAGLALAWFSSRTSFVVALLLVGAIVLYDGPLKKTRAAPAVMGLCRSLNLLLGMSLETVNASLSVLVPTILIGLYVASLTLFARSEAGESDPLRLKAATTGMCLALLGLLGLPILHGTSGLPFVICVCMLVLVVHRIGRQAANRALASHVQAAVPVFLLILILFDALIVVSARGWATGAVVAGLLLPVVLLRDRFRMT
jgi:4-hydroxybenzoate polyprenyltransferase